jgi:hypothetical protein
LALLYAAALALLCSPAVCSIFRSSCSFWNPADSHYLVCAMLDCTSSYLQNFLPIMHSSSSCASDWHSCSLRRFTPADTPQLGLHSSVSTGSYHTDGFVSTVGSSCCSCWMATMALSISHPFNCLLPRPRPVRFDGWP